MVLPETIDLQEKIQDLIRKHHQDSDVRRAFLNSVWDALKPDYEEMVQALQLFCGEQLRHKDIKATINGRSKACESVEDSIKRREKHSQKDYKDLNDIFNNVHDLAGIRIVLDFPDDFYKADAFIRQAFEEFRPPNKFHADREVGESWKPWFGAYSSHNHQVLISKNSTVRELSRFRGVLFEVQLTTCADNLYNKLAHPILYKRSAGLLTQRDEIVVDISHGIAWVHNLCLMYFKGRLKNAHNESECSKLRRIIAEGSGEGDSVEMDDLHFPPGGKISARALSEVFDQSPPEECRSVTNLQRWLAMKLNEIQQHHSTDIDCMRDLRVTDPRDDKKRIVSTKGGLLQDASQWVVDHPDFIQWRSAGRSRLLWVKGNPGKGKTMLLCRIIDELAAELNQTPIYFFCQATDERLNNATGVLRGLVYFLVDQKPSLMRYMRDKHKSAGKQLFEDVNAWIVMAEIFTAMLADPCLKDQVVILDALDECTSDLQSLLGLISRSISSSHGKWIVSSRNRPDIQSTLDNTQQVMLHLELNQDSISAAVEIFIQSRVTELPFDKAIRDRVQHLLTKNSENTFLWVALVCKDLENTRPWNAIKVAENAPRGLDDLYKQMMQRMDGLDQEDAQHCRDILATATLAYRPLHIKELRTLSDLPPAIHENISFLSDLISLCGSFLTLQDNIIYFIHQSAKDFILGNTAQEKPAHKILPVGKQVKHYDMFAKSLTALSNELQRDIYHLEFPGFPIDRVSSPNPDPLEPIRYSCIYWVDHLRDSNLSNISEAVRDDKLVHGFLQTKFLNWLEALSLMRSISVGVYTMNKLEKLLDEAATRNITTVDIRAVRYDLWRFVLAFKDGIRIAPLQVYASALIFSPATSRVRQLYNNQEPDWFTSKPVMESNWNACLQTLQNHSGNVNTVAFSADSQQLASGLEDGTIQIWDPMQGICQQTLEDHSDCINAVAFSANSRWLASGSDDKTAKIWDLARGICRWTLEVQSLGVIAVAFSVDSQWLASGSYDGIVEIWDPAQGISRQTLHHSDIVSMMTFSADGQRLASSSEGIIKIWDLTQGTCQQTFMDHRHYISSITFLADSQWLASCSGKDIKIWDTIQGICQQTLEGHSQEVSAVAFLADGQQLVSHSYDGTLKIWDTQGVCQQTLVGFESMDKVAFSPDGRFLASDSINGISIWDAQGKYRQALEHHSGPVGAVAFSTDSQRLASGSTDYTIKIWDAQGICQQTLQGHNGPVIAVTFSADSQRLASGSDDKTVKIWDAQGICQQTLQGH
ncbi:hypothetical protein B0I35DRAFT_388886, partial [Stachybotrys elegans]